MNLRKTLSLLLYFMFGMYVSLGVYYVFQTAWLTALICLVLAFLSHLVAEALDRQDAAAAAQDDWVSDEEADEFPWDTRKKENTDA